MKLFLAFDSDSQKSLIIKLSIAVRQTAVFKKIFEKFAAVSQTTVNKLSMIYDARTAKGLFNSVIVVAAGYCSLLEISSLNSLAYW